MSDEELDIECFEDCEEEDEIVPESDDIFDKLEPPAKKGGRRKKKLAKKKKKKAVEENEDREEDELKPAAKDDGAQTSQGTKEASKTDTKDSILDPKQAKAPATAPDQKSSAAGEEAQKKVETKELSEKEKAELKAKKEEQKLIAQSKEEVNKKLAMREKQMKIAKRIEKNKRLRGRGFARTITGYTFQGVDQSALIKAAKIKKLKQMGQKIVDEPKKDPQMKFPPIEPDGGMGVGFNQDMIAPKKGTKLNPKLYEATFGVSVTSKQDESTFTGKFTESKKQRMLAAKELSGDQLKMQFTPYIDVHTKNDVKIKCEFDNPEQMTISGFAETSMEIKEPSIFKSATDLKAMSKDSFPGGEPKLDGAMPPIIDDPEKAEQLKEKSDGAADYIQMMLSSNFFVGILLGGSMQYLWGMIRALQVISLSGLVRVNIPVHLHIFLSVCVVFANMDILSTEVFFEENMDFKDT